MTDDRATLTFELERITFGHAEKMRRAIDFLIDVGAFNVRSGNVTMHFDLDGVLQEVETHSIRKWRKKALEAPKRPINVVNKEVRV